MQSVARLLTPAMWLAASLALAADPWLTVPGGEGPGRG